jgi:hypothetical protein
MHRGQPIQSSEQLGRIAQLLGELPGTGVELLHLRAFDSPAQGQCLPERRVQRQLLPIALGRLGERAKQLHRPVEMGDRLGMGAMMYCALTRPSVVSDRALATPRATMPASARLYG